MQGQVSLKQPQREVITIHVTMVVLFGEKGGNCDEGGWRRALLQC